MKIGLSIAGPVTAKGLETRDSREITMGLFPRKAGNKKTQAAQAQAPSPGLHNGVAIFCFVQIFGRGEAVKRPLGHGGFLFQQMYQFVQVWLRTEDWTERWWCLCSEHEENHLDPLAGKPKRKATR